MGEKEIDQPTMPEYAGPYVMLWPIEDGWRWRIQTEGRAISSSAYSLVDALGDARQVAEAHGLS